jgi:leucyl/phenylalanyl-tRNA--protein transferase
MVLKFPPVDTADESGLLALGGDLDVGTLELAYRSGIFPWPVERQPLLWFAPPHRAILEFDEVRISKRLQRYFKTVGFDFRMDTAFEQVIRACANSKHRKGESGTWITPAMIEAYIAFHQRGFAHSFETFLEDELVGGLYGVKIGSYFAGESMFHTSSNASKFALVNAVGYLRRQGLSWMDVQVQSPFLESLGVKEIARMRFMDKLRSALG